MVDIVSRVSWVGQLTAVDCLQRWVEIGVWRGRFAEQILRQFPTADYVGVDPWTRMSRHLALTAERLKPWGSKVTLCRETSADAALRLAGGELFDVVYIDGNHRRGSVLQDLRLWSPLVRSGGIVSGHDYGDLYPGVERAVRQFVHENQIPTWYVTRDSSPRDPSSFFWIHP